MHREMLLDFSELSQLSIGCRRCKTRVLIDCNDREARIPEECPSCGEEYDGSFRSALQTYREVFRKLSDPDGRRVEIRISGENQ